MKSTLICRKNLKPKLCEEKQFQPYYNPNQNRVGYIPPLFFYRPLVEIMKDLDKNIQEQENVPNREDNSQTGEFIEFNEN